MPFQKPLARSFTASSIRANAPALPGVYGVSNARNWIYIGYSDNIQRSLIEHLDDQATFARNSPTGFVFEICYSEIQRTRCERLIREYRPLYTPS